MMPRTEQQAKISKVGEFMRGDPAMVPYEATIMDALQTMIERDRHSVLVMSGDEVAGIIADADVGRLVAKGVDLKAAWVRDFVAACMLTGNQPCVQIREDDSVVNALRVMDNWGAGQIVVVNEKDKVVGTVSALDALKGWLEEVSRT